MEFIKLEDIPEPEIWPEKRGISGRGVFKMPYTISNDSLF